MEKLIEPKYKIGDVVIIEKDKISSHYRQAVIIRAYIPKGRDDWEYWVDPEHRLGWIKDIDIVKKI